MSSVPSSSTSLSSSVHSYLGAQSSNSQNTDTDRSFKKPAVSPARSLIDATNNETVQKALLQIKHKK